MEKFWAGGQESHEQEIKREWLRERHRLLFKLSLADNDEQKKSIQLKMEELDAQYSRKSRSTGYSNYVAQN